MEGWFYLMADQYLITAYEGETTPEDIRLRPLPLPEPIPESVCYLFPVLYPQIIGSDPRIMTLQEFDAVVNNIVLRELPNYIQVQPEVIIVLRDPNTLALETPPIIPPPTYYGTLKRYNGVWVKAKLRYFNGSDFVEVLDLKYWDGYNWRLVNATGI
jgi:hypothetical protein